MKAARLLVIAAGLLVIVARLLVITARRVTDFRRPVVVKRCRGCRVGVVVKA